MSLYEKQWARLYDKGQSGHRFPSVLPALQIRARRRRLFHMLYHLRPIMLVDASRRIDIPGIAVRLTHTEFETAPVVWVRRRVHIILQQVDCAIEIERVSLDYPDMQFARELRAKRLPVALHDRAQVVVLFPVLGDLVIDPACPFVEDSLRISVITDRAENGFPCVEL